MADNVEKLNRRIAELEAELISLKKYGLVWDKIHSSDNKIDECINNIPVLTYNKEKSILKSGIDNILIKGDNYHALLSLSYLNQECIDIIYIDPPYNTGNKDFFYNDVFIDEENGYRHSCWLNFMSQRLLLAKKLLNEKGVIYLSIDDNEQANLKILCDQIFGEHNFLACLPRITKKSGKDHAVGVAKNHDYVLVYCKNKEKADFQGLPSSNEDYPLKDAFFDERGGYKLNQTLDYDSLWYNPKMDFEINIDGKSFYPGGSEDLHIKRHNGIHKPKDWVWRWSLEKFKFGLENGFVVIKKGKDRERIYTKTYANASISNTKPYKIEYRERETLLSSISLVDNEFSNDNAKKDITRVGFSEFGFPKPVNLIKQLIKIVKNANVVCDFFAGSGTTGQAVLELNNEDGKNRKFILCTNNENSIFDNITLPRIKTVINGVRPDGSFYGNPINCNLRVFDIEFVKNTDNSEQTIYSLTEKIDGLICIREEIFDIVNHNSFSSHYKNENKHLFIYNDFYNENKFENFRNEVINCVGKKIVYLFSLDNTIVEKYFNDDEIIVKPIPGKIYDIYQEARELIKRGK